MPSKTKQTPDEKVYYENKRGIRVSSISFTTDTEIFYLKDIASVKEAAGRGQNHYTGLVLILVGVILGGIGAIADVTIMIILAIAAFLIGGILVGVTKPVYIVKLKIGGKEITALKSNNKIMIEKVILAINSGKSEY